MSGPIRGMRNVEGKLFVVSGNQLYQISNTGIAQPVGTIPGTGMVQMAHNQVTGGNQLMIVNGSAGYIYTTSTEVFGRITDPGFPGAKSVGFLAGYFTFVEPQGRFIGHSDLVDGYSYNTLDRNQAETKPDRIVTHMESADEVVVFGERTTQFFVNQPTGDGVNPLVSKGITIDVGCAGTNAVVLLDNSLMWLDDHGIFQRMNGYQAVPISNRVIERAISGYDWANVVSYTYEDKGHKIAYWTFRDGLTLGYDVTTGKWHRRASYGLDRWRLTSIVYWRRKWYGGDFQTGKIYELDWEYKYDGTDPLVRRYVTAAIWNEQRRFSVPSVELVFDTGGPGPSAVSFPVQPVGPTISGNAPDGTNGEPYTPFSYTGTPGDAPITGFSITSGLAAFNAAGFSFSTSGEITGTPTGSVTITVRVTDANGLYDELTDTITAVGAVYTSFAALIDGGGILRVSETGENWDTTIDSGLGVDVVLLSGAGGKLFAFGAGGVGRVSSDNGATFVDIVGLDAAQPPKTLAYSDGVWILAYFSGTFFSRSTDGVNFSNVDSMDARQHMVSSAIGDTFIVYGINGVYRISTDKGLTWADGVLPRIAIKEFDAATTQGDTHVAIFDSYFYTSTTGATGSWTERAAPFTSLYAKSFHSDSSRISLVYNDETAYSDDLFATYTLGGSVSSFATLGDDNMTYNGSHFIVGLTEAIDISTDGITWTRAFSNGSALNAQVATVGPA